MGVRIKKILHRGYRSLVQSIPIPVKHLIKEILWYPYAYIRLYGLRKTPILVYQMGKVGSRTVHRSLEAQGLWAIHIHTLDLERIARLRNERKPGITTRSLPLRRYLWLHNHIVKKGRPAQYITLVREPIGRNVSMFFQGLERFTGYREAHEVFSLEELKARFTRMMNDREQSILRPLHWFDEEIKPALGIDVYDYPFPREKGYLRITQGNADLLIVKIEADDTAIEQGIGEFLSLTDFKLARTNVGDEKFYGEVYREFKRTIVIPPEIIDLCCNSKYARHFYTPEEIEKTRIVWLRSTAPEQVHS